MAIPRKQVGWGTDSNLLWEIWNAIDKLTRVTSKSGGGSGSGTVTGVAQTVPNVIYTGNNLAITGNNLCAFIDDSGINVLTKWANYFTRKNILSTAWDLTSAGADVVGAIGGSVYYGLKFKQNGLRALYIRFTSGNIQLIETSLPSAWDVVNESVVSTTTLISSVVGLNNLDVTRNGQYVFVSYSDTSSTDQKLAKFELTTAWQGDTANLIETVSLASGSTRPNKVVFSDDGKRMFSMNNFGANAKIQQYNLTTSHSLSTLGSVVKNVNINSVFPISNDSYSNIHLDSSGTKLLLSSYATNPDLTLLELTVPNELGDLIDNS